VITLDADLANDHKWPALSVNPELAKPLNKFCAPLFRSLLEKLNKSLSRTERTSKEWEWAQPIADDEPLDVEDQTMVDFSEKFQELLKQSKGSYLPSHVQLIIFANCAQTLLRGIKRKNLRRYHSDLIEFIKTSHSDLWKSLCELKLSAPLPSTMEKELTNVCEIFRTIYLEEALEEL